MVLAIGGYATAGMEVKRKRKYQRERSRSSRNRLECLRGIAPDYTFRAWALIQIGELLGGVRPRHTQPVYSGQECAIVQDEPFVRDIAWQ
jgi:hypothetical protein